MRSIHSNGIKTRKTRWKQLRKHAEERAAAVFVGRGVAWPRIQPLRLALSGVAASNRVGRTQRRGRR